MEWTGNGMEWRKEKSGLEMEMAWKGKKDKSEEWEDEWIMIPPTPLSNRLWLVMTGLIFLLLKISFYFIYLVYNRWEDNVRWEGEREVQRGERREKGRYEEI